MEVWKYIHLGEYARHVDKKTSKSVREQLIIKYSFVTMRHISVLSDMETAARGVWGIGRYCRFKK